MPCLESVSASRLARCLVRVKTRTLPISPRRSELHQERRLQVLRDGIDGLRDPDGRRRGPLEVDRERVLQHLARQLHDRRRHRGREEERLAARRQVLQDAADVGQESHVEHPVRLVEHEDLEAFELRVRESEVVEQAARCRDQDVDARAEGMLLRAHADAAEDRGGRERRVDGELARVLVDLGGELARGRQHERPRHAALLAHEAVQDRKDEGGRLAAAGHGAGEHVLALEGGGHGVLLDRGRAGEAHLLDAAQQVRVESEIGKRHANRVFPRFRRAGRRPLSFHPACFFRERRNRRRGLRSWNARRRPGGHRQRKAGVASHILRDSANLQLGQ